MPEIATPRVPLRIRKRWFQKSEKGREGTLSDSGYASPYEIVCFGCEKSSYTLEIRFHPFNLRHFSLTDVGFDREEIISYGGAGQNDVWLQCPHCQTHYYVGVGWYEPNNGRDVFVLHTILEVEPQER